jgi:hypothetical protein
MYCLNTSSIDVGKLTRYVMKINSVTSLVYPSLTCIYILYIHCTTCMSNLICTSTLTKKQYIFVFYSVLLHCILVLALVKVTFYKV